MRFAFVILLATACTPSHIQGAQALGGTGEVWLYVNTAPFGSPKQGIYRCTDADRQAGPKCRRATVQE